MKNIILGLAIPFAIIFIIGSAGAWDKGNITFLQCLIQTAIGTAIEWFALKSINEEE